MTSSKDAKGNDHRDNNHDNSDTDGEDDSEDGKKGLRNGWRGGSSTRDVISMLRLFHELLVHLLVVLQLLLMALLKVVLLLLYQPLLFTLVRAMMRHGGDILSPGMVHLPPVPVCLIAIGAGAPSRGNHPGTGYHTDRPALHGLSLVAHDLKRPAGYLSQQGA